ncbi:hypothetical protein EVJ24_02165 [Exiguobacterium sp. SH1S21]|uniref:hypothetical protein n=1 Tax=Exiguobacterium sp. SH1S21 TaxID=2510953 RepID=UPI0010408FD1|nr:hypothetical protein [Exiguobacterium sp. SH1S21]TCI57599.1 hypothetical protein EVJ24_02165 [Exiguobacterium sp. SH1S21]
MRKSTQNCYTLYVKAAMPSIEAASKIIPASVPTAHDFLYFFQQKSQFSRGEPTDVTGLRLVA